MSSSPTSTDRYLSLYLALAQYPILGGRIRARMRRDLFERGILTSQAFETRAREMAIRSQEQEGLRNPYAEEGWYVVCYCPVGIILEREKQDKGEELAEDILRRQYTLSLGEY